MAYGNKPLQATSITSPGFFGLNTQDSGVNLNSSFALEAFNAVIDQSGRIASRKGWAYKTTSGGTNVSVESLFEFNNGDGTYTVLSAGNNKLYTGETTMVEKAVRNSDDTADLSYTISDNNWQIVQAEYDTGLNKSAHAYFIQAGQPTLIYHKLGSTAHAHTGSFGFQRLGDMGTLPAGYTTSTFTPNCGLAAYGRLWLADIGNDDLTVYYSALLDASDFGGIGSGFINLEQVVPGGESIVALAEHNNFLFIFCKNNIVIYANANDIDNITLADVIEGVGCIARDSVQNIGSDVLFLSNSGVRSIGRTIQEKSAPLRDISINVRDQLLNFIRLEDMKLCRSIYFEPDAFYLLSLPSIGFVYCFDVRTFLENGASRATIWNSISPKAFAITNDDRLLLGKESGIAQYTGYKDNNLSYTFTYYTPYLDFGAPSISKILKKIVVTVFGTNATALDIRWAFDYSSGYKSIQTITTASNIAEYGIAEYGIGEYSVSVPYEQIKRQLSGNGNIIQLGIEVLINGNGVSIQKLDVYAVTGRTI